MCPQTRDQTPEAQGGRKAGAVPSGPTVPPNPLRGRWEVGVSSVPPTGAVSR